MDRTSQEDITMSAQSEAALLAREQFAQSDQIDRARLIGAVVDIPGLAGSVTGEPGDLGHAIGLSQRIPATRTALNNPTQGAQLITEMVDLPAGLVSSVTAMAGVDNQVPAGTVGAAHPHLGAQLIGGTVDLPGGLIASGASDLPENLGHRVGPAQLFPASAAPSGTDTAAGQGQIHQLVTAMAGFGGDQGSAITNLTVQNEVESARTSLAASLHFAQP
jgi:hypothetical protein